VLFDKVVKPDTFNDEFNVTTLLKLELPLTFNVPLTVVLLDSIVKPDIFNEEFNVTTLLNVDIPLIFNELNVVYI
jgi:hypothetical protein